mmetsp:Transcript_26712/g.54687  ORF Transcript_26712/g.54687 Transcript_26712/m.54687 type:complete len:622 (+) Transcript_26712:26-1891(+)
MTKRPKLGEAADAVLSDAEGRAWLKSHSYDPNTLELSDVPQFSDGIERYIRFANKRNDLLQSNPVALAIGYPPIPGPGGRVQTLRWLFSNYATHIAASSHRQSGHFMCAAAALCDTDVLDYLYHEWLLGFQISLPANTPRGSFDGYAHGTPLLFACRNTSRGHKGLQPGKSYLEHHTPTTCVKWLLAHGASLSEVSARGASDFKSCFSEAVANGDLELLNFLYERDPDGLTRESPGGHLPLHSIAESRHAKGVLEWLLARGAARPEDLNKTPPGGSPLLHSLIHCEDDDEDGFAVWQWLISHGADINALDEDETSCLYKACCADTLRLVKFIYARAPHQMMLENKWGEIPFHFAVIQGHLDTAKFLFAQEPAVLDATANGGSDAFLLPIYKHHEASYGDEVVVKGESLVVPTCARWLLSVGADPSSRDSEGRTPLHWAVLNGDLDTAKFLVLETAAAGDATKEDHEGLTSLGAAFGREDGLEIFQFLLLQRRYTVPELTEAALVATFDCVGQHEEKREFGSSERVAALASLSAWAEGHVARHRVFVSVVLFGLSPRSGSPLLSGVAFCARLLGAFLDVRPPSAVKMRELAADFGAVPTCWDSDLDYTCFWDGSSREEEDEE